MNTARLAYPRQDVWKDIFYDAVDAARGLRKKFPADTSEPLEYLISCAYPGDTQAVRSGATYKSLAYIGHLMGMDAASRDGWYRFARAVPLSQAHAGIIIARLHARDEMMEEIDKLLLEAA